MRLKSQTLNNSRDKNVVISNIVYLSSSTNILYFLKNLREETARKPVTNAEKIKFNLTFWFAMEVLPYISYRMQWMMMLILPERSNQFQIDEK